MKNKHIVLMSITIFLLAAILSPSSALAKKITVVIESRILDFDPQPGMKSNQSITVDFSGKKLSSRYKTGTTDFFGVDLESIRNNFKVNTKYVSVFDTRFTASGETASGVGIIPNINYSFEIFLSAQGKIKIKGCHDGYPAYKITVDGKEKYSYDHKSKEIYKLFGECDIKVEQ